MFSPDYTIGLIQPHLEAIVLMLYEIILWGAWRNRAGNKTWRFIHKNYLKVQTRCLKRYKVWNAYRKRSRMFHKKKSKHTIGLLWNSSSMMTMTSRRFFSVTWNQRQHAVLQWPQNVQIHVNYIIICARLIIILFPPVVKVGYALGWSEEWVGLSRSHQRYGTAPGWRAAGTGSSPSRWSKMCLLRHLQSKKWYFISDKQHLVVPYSTILLFFFYLNWFITNFLISSIINVKPGIGSPL